MAGPAPSSKQTNSSPDESSRHPSKKNSHGKPAPMDNAGECSAYDKSDADDAQRKSFAVDEPRRERRSFESATQTEDEHHSPTPGSLKLSPALGEALIENLNLFGNLKPFIGGGRVNLITQREKTKRGRDYYQKAQNEVLSGLETLLESIPPRRIPPELIESVNNLYRIQDELDEEQQFLDQMERRQGADEYRLTNVLSEISEIVEKIYPGLRNKQYDGRQLSYSRIKSAATSEAEDPLLQAYYDKRSSVPILFERLLELESGHAEERAERESRTNLGEPVSPPDLEFYQEYSRTRDSLAYDFRSAQREAEELFSRCINEGLLPRRSSVSIESAKHQVHEQIYPPLYQQLDIQEPVIPALDQPPATDGQNKRDAINDWLSAAPGPQEQQSFPVTGPPTPELRKPPPTFLNEV
ncbi:hypothetical protein IWX90DRAFT_481981 [Phyllosticta citrichinensis]|uniref:Uncharacterized protein n=1 Tax=Phyllosticta citrichinensis TaxID=1130410 RepID=A0ABR1Y4Z5_9PEZI